VRGARGPFLNIVAREIADPRVLEAFVQVARSGFVPEGSEAEAEHDRPVALPHRQTTSQPSLIGRMIEAARIEAGDRVLEVGTGFGFQTALLAVLAKEVVSVERFPGLAEHARANLERAGFTNADVFVGDGWEGLEERSPYDAIVVSAAAEEVPEALVGQLREGGRLVLPLKRGRSDDVVVLVKGRDGVTEERLITPARFVPLVRGRSDA
jgi:protein-L-isoaspartate(D-aspartate) O-methyltransferase